MGERLSETMVARLRERAGQANRRSETSEMAAGSVDSGELMADMPRSDDPAVRDYLEGMNTPFAGMISNMVTGDGSQARGLFGAFGRMLGGRQIFASMGGRTMSFGPKRKPKAAPPPATEKQVAKVEEQLGFELPRDLRQYYLEVAEGGVGPGDGLYNLKQLLAKWREMTREPVGPRGQKWPARLLPIEGDRWDLTCIDRDSGKLVYFDIEEIDYGGWKKCFRDEAESLEAWLAKWLDRPSPEEVAKRRAERQTQPKMATEEETQAWLDENDEFMRRAEIFSMTLEQRRALGLPDVGWEEKVFEGFDLSKVKPLRPGAKGKTDDE
jgi:hypothetical protein